MVKPLTFLTLRFLSSASVNVKTLIFSLRTDVMKNIDVEIIKLIYFNYLK